MASPPTAKRPGLLDPAWTLLSNHGSSEGPRHSLPQTLPHAVARLPPAPLRPRSEEGVAQSGLDADPLPWIEDKHPSDQVLGRARLLILRRPVAPLRKRLAAKVMRARLEVRVHRCHAKRVDRAQSVEPSRGSTAIQFRVYMRARAGQPWPGKRVRDRVYG